MASRPVVAQDPLLSQASVPSTQKGDSNTVMKNRTIFLRECDPSTTPLSLPLLVSENAKFDCLVVHVPEEMTGARLLETITLNSQGGVLCSTSHAASYTVVALYRDDQKAMVVNAMRDAGGGYFEVTLYLCIALDSAFVFCLA
jgi:hypothetical protein